MGKKVLAIDLDPQGNLSFSLGIDDEAAYTIYDVFKGNCDISDAVQKGGICDVIASNILLSGVELELTGVGREYILREQMETIRDEYDYIILDISCVSSWKLSGRSTTSSYWIRRRRCRCSP